MTENLNLTNYSINWDPGKALPDLPFLPRPIYAETGQVPLQAKHEHATIRYWHHVTNLPTTHIVNICYKELRKLDEAGAENWCSYVRKILSAANSHHYWTDQGSMTRSRLPVIKANLERIHITKCMENIANTDPRNKLRTYKKIKKEFSLEKYLLVVKNPKHRQALTRLRLSSHQLEIEMGRHTRPPVEADLRICKMCKENKIDNEVHFLTECTSNAPLREDLFNKAKSTIKDIAKLTKEEKFVNLLTTNDNNLIINIAKFVCDSFTLRKNKNQSLS